MDAHEVGTQSQQTQEVPQIQTLQLGTDEIFKLLAWAQRAPLFVHEQVDLLRIQQRVEQWRQAQLVAGLGGAEGSGEESGG